LAALIGLPWSWRGGNCWDFVAHVEAELFGRILPAVDVPVLLDKRWVLKAFDGHPERASWREVETGPHGMVTAADGALVLMAHLKMPGHVGVWLKPEQIVLHCDEANGVCAESVLALQQRGWKKLRFFEPK
jgi:hypothetical protein